jgi:hypothetical protein
MFPYFVLVAMSLFAAALGAVSLQDAVRHR